MNPVMPGPFPVGTFVTTSLNTPCNLEMEVFACPTQAIRVTVSPLQSWHLPGGSFCPVGVGAPMGQGAGISLKLTEHVDEHLGACWQINASSINVLCVAEAGWRIAVTKTEELKVKRQISPDLPPTCIAATQTVPKVPKRHRWPNRRRSPYPVPVSFMGEGLGQVFSALEELLKLRRATATSLESTGETHQSQEITSKVPP